MPFYTSSFVCLVAITFVLFYLPPLRRWQNLVLIAASFVFYAYALPVLLLLLLFAITLDAACSYRAVFDGGRPWTARGITLNLAMLGAFKYGPLVASTLAALGLGARTLAAFSALPLPIGISFYTFEGISLVADANRGGVTMERGFGRHWLRTALFVSFFPHLVSGPILKAHQFLPQVKPKRLAEVPWDLAFRQLVAGYFLKMVVADNLAAYTRTYMSPGVFELQSSLLLLAMVFAYSMQIFADFAGYSLIAIGIAALFGYELPANFDFPYISRSFSEFWTRWHISLSTWLREYLYIPLGGNRRGRVRTYLNLMIVMALGGLWHGAAWSYMVWGLWHGLALAVERFTRDAWQGDRWWPEWLRAPWVFAYVSVGWVLFCFPDFRQVLAFARAVATHWRYGTDLTVLFNLAVYSLPVLVYHALYLWQRRASARGFSPGWQAAAYGALLVLLMLNSGKANAFIYFQF